MNRVDLTGRLTKDPVINMTNSGTTVANFTIACDRRFKKEGQPEADFINCVAWSKTAEFIEKWFHKGDGIEVIGSIQTGSYKNNNGDTVYTTTVNVEGVEFGKGSKSNKTNNAPVDADGFMDVPESEDGTIPFK